MLIYNSSNPEDLDPGHLGSHLAASINLILFMVFLRSRAFVKLNLRTGIYFVYSKMIRYCHLRISYSSCRMLPTYLGRSIAIVPHPATDRTSSVVSRRPFLSLEVDFKRHQ